MKVKYSKEFLEKENFIKSEIERLEKVEPRNFRHHEAIKNTIEKLKIKLKSFGDGYRLAARERDPQDELKTKVKKSLNSSNACLYHEEEGCQGEEGDVGKVS
ncbi:hypothetical protein KAT51_00950 [bacterium]|nr:hypothetical protein [bacterium]